MRRQQNPLGRSSVALAASLLLWPAIARGQADSGIPITDARVVARCGTCHPADARGQMQGLSWTRATPEGWQAVVQRMIRDHDLSVTPIEARAIVRALGSTHGLAPGESKPVMPYAERRVHDEAATFDAAVVETCGRCHEAARALSWRRTADGWAQFTRRHAERYRFTADEGAIAALVESTPFSSPDWTAWRAHGSAPALAGRWLLTAHVQGRGMFHGDMEVESIGVDEWSTRVRLRPAAGGEAIERTGRSVVYGGTAWRGRSRGRTDAATPDDLSSDAREAMWVAPDGARIEGRWFWGQYDELGFDVAMRRPSTGPTLLLVEPPAVAAGSESRRIRLIGDGFPAQVTRADVALGPGVTVRRIVSSSPTEIVAELDVAAAATSGKRRVSVGSASLEGAMAIYDRVDYVKVMPESSLATFANEEYAHGIQQFEAIGFQRGPDGKPQTGDDLALGPVPVAWSMDVFYETDRSRQARVGTLSATGLFTPAAVSPGTNFDVWMVATSTTEKGPDGKPLVGKGYLVVTVPTYTFEGRTYVRELGRWVETGSGAR